MKQQEKKPCPHCSLFSSLGFLPLHIQVCGNGSPVFSQNKKNGLKLSIKKGGAGTNWKIKC